MPLKRSYATEAEVPTEQKANYVPKGGRYVLDVEGFDNIDGVLDKNTELLGKVSGHASELAAKDTEITRLKGEIASANVLPRGHRAVPTADAELLDAVKAKGVTATDTFNTLHKEHGEYKTKADAADRRARFADLSKKLKWGEGAPEVLELVPGLPEWEDRDVSVNGKTEKAPHAKIVTKNAQGQDEVSYRPFAEYFTEKHAALLPSVAAKGQEAGTRVPGSAGGGGTPADNDPLGSRLKAQRDAQAANPNPLVPRAAATANA